MIELESEYSLREDNECVLLALTIKSKLVGLMNKYEDKEFARSIIAYQVAGNV